MRIHVRTTLVGLLLLAAVSRAETPSPDQVVTTLLHTQYCTPERPGQPPREPLATMRRDPRPYLPFLRARVSLERLERIEGEKDFQEQRREMFHAAWYLALLGGDEERDFLMEQMRQAQREGDQLTQQVNAWLSRTPPPSREDAAFRQLVEHRGIVQGFELNLLTDFKEVGDPRLRDLLLPRLDHDRDGREGYIEYFMVTCREDPRVRARLRRMLEAPDDPSLEELLRRFFRDIVGEGRLAGPWGVVRSH